MYVYFLKQSFYKWKNERKKQKNKVSIGYPFFALGVVSTGVKRECNSQALPTTINLY